MSTRSKLQRLALVAAFATSAAVLAAAGPALAHGGGYSGSHRDGLVNTIRPIMYHPTPNGTIRPIGSGAVSPLRPVLLRGPIDAGSIPPPTGPIVRDHRGGGQGEGGVTTTSIPRPPSSSSLCIVSCGAHVGTPTYYNAGNTIRDHRPNPYGWGN